MSPINTKRLTLQPYYASMVSDAHVRWLNDPEVVKYSEQRHRQHTLESIHKYVNDIACDPDSYIWGIFLNAATDNSDPHLPIIGTITAHCDRNNGIANMGIMIGDKTQWGKGYGQEAWLMVCNWLFDHGIRKIEAGCHFENRPMRRLAKLCGMELEGVVHDHFLVDGKPHHLFLYGKMKPTSVSVSIDEQSAGVLGKTSR